MIRYYFDQESSLWKLKFQGFWKDFPVIFMKFWISLICWPHRISNKFSIGKVYHMFVRVASYYSYYEQQHKCDILNADQKSPNHIDLEFEISFRKWELSIKVSKYQKQFFLKLHCPKDERNVRQNSALWS